MPLNGVTNQRAQLVVVHSTHVQLIDDTDDGGVHGRQLLAERLAGGASFEHDNDALADAGADRIDGQQRRARRLALRRLGLHQQQLRALELRALLRRDDCADDARENHRLDRRTSDRRCRRCRHRPALRSDGTESWLPCRARRTPCSPTPAPTESTATSGRPTSSPSAPSGCTSSSLMPSKAGILEGGDDVADDAGDLHALARLAVLGGRRHR